MTLKEAALKSLEDIDNITNYLAVYNHIIAKKYYDFGTQKTPSNTVSAVLGDFVRNGDTRIKRIGQEGGTYSYYLSKNEQNIVLNSSLEVINTTPSRKNDKIKSYDERDLHKLLSSYLKSTNVYAKTIFHEQSTFGKDSNQIWTHPDMVGVRFLTLHTKASQIFLKAINRADMLKLTSYEIKKEINNDSELKKAFFQAVSNSSWANYGYLVAFEFSDNLMEEMERLNQAFGIGIIKLTPNPYQSKVLFQPKYRDLDFKTIDKLCKINKEFERFIEQIEKLMIAEERFYNSTEKELDEFCDACLTNESEILEYLKEKYIPFELDEKGQLK
jgi:uncharacterized protein